MMVKLEGGQGQVDDRRASRAARHPGLRPSRPEAAVRAQDRRLQGPGARARKPRANARGGAGAAGRRRRRRAARMRAERTSGAGDSRRAARARDRHRRRARAWTARSSCCTTSSASRRDARRASCSNFMPATMRRSTRCALTCKPSRTGAIRPTSIGSLDDCTAESRRESVRSTRSLRQVRTVDAVREAGPRLARALARQSRSCRRWATCTRAM